MTTVDEPKKLIEALCRKYRSIPWIPISQMQRESSRDDDNAAPARGGVWISKMMFRAPEDNDGLREALDRVCEELDKKAPDRSFAPELQVPLNDVGVEFIGRRSGALQDQAAERQRTEEDKLKALESECESDMTILYIHGGGL